MGRSNPSSNMKNAPNKECGLRSLTYHKYILSNGLEVVLHRDTTAPIVSLAVQYHVGSSRETTGKTGFAHFFEHMLFQRSEHLPRNAFFQRIEQMGGTFNGGTSNDGTVYYETVPRDALEKILWMESDRMGFFINTVTEGGLRREIDVVSNEKRQQENVPYGLAFDLLFREIFPSEHPYSWSVIGEIPDLRSASVDDVKHFYRTFYTPANATLALVGDFDVATARRLIERYFGELTGAAAPEQPKPWNATLTAPRRIRFTDTFCNAPMLLIATPTVEAYHRDGYALDMLSNLLAGDKKSPLYKVIVEERGLAPEVEMFHYQLERAGVLITDIKAYAGVSLSEVYDAYREALARFERDGVDSADLQRNLTAEELRTYNRLTSTNSIALSMAHDNVFGGQPDRLLTELDDYRAVTPEEVMRVFHAYLKERPDLCISLVPSEGESLAIEGSQAVEVQREPVTEQALNADEGALVDDPYPFSASGFDRSVEPSMLSNTPELNLPPQWHATLPNGIVMRGISACKVPIVHFAIELNDGMLCDSVDKVGVANLTAMILNEGTEQLRADALEEAFGHLGARVRISASRESMALTGNCLKRNARDVMELATSMIQQPRWETSAFELVRERTLDAIAQRETEPKNVAFDQFNRLLFGQHALLSYNFQGTHESLARITLDDLKRFHATHIAPAHTSISVVGLTPDEARSVFAPLDGAWQPCIASDTIHTPLLSDTFSQHSAATSSSEASKQTSEASKPEVLDVQNKTNMAKYGNEANATDKVDTRDVEHSRTPLYLVDYPDARQSYIVVGARALSATDRDAYPATVVNDHLGESSSGLLFQRLRLEHGYTYGAYSAFIEGKQFNLFQAWSGVQATATDKALDLLRSTLIDYRDNYQAEWLDTSRATLLRMMLSDYETPASQLNMLRWIAVYGLPEEYLKQQEQTLRTLSIDKARHILHTYLDFNRMIVVVVGDARARLPELRALGWADVRTL